MIDWLFRDRTTGRIVVAQAPNVPLVIFLVAAVVRWLTHPEGSASAVVSGVGTAALIWWAGDELLRGVNPFRRILGAVVLTATLARLF